MSSGTQGQAVVPSPTKDIFVSTVPLPTVP